MSFIRRSCPLLSNGDYTSTWIASEQPPIRTALLQNYIGGPAIGSKETLDSGQCPGRIYIGYDVSYTTRLCDDSRKMSKPKLSNMARELDRDLRAVRQIINRPIEALIESGGLTGPQQSAMQVLVESDGLSLKDLSKELGLAHSTVSGIVDRLEKQGLVKRQTDEVDRRLAKLVVTDQVRKFLRETWPALEMHPLAEALRAATPAEREQVLQGVRTLRRLLERGNE
jgi:DNA-binding MarR family transcriptional regulator